MRLREARRLFNRLFIRGYTNENIYAVLKLFDPKITHRKGLYTCVINTSDRRIRRRHRCAFRLIRLVYDLVSGFDFSRFQNQPVYHRPMASPLSTKVVETLRRRNVPFWGVSGFQRSRPQPLPGLPPPHPEVQKQIDYTRSLLPLETQDVVSSYCHSSTVTDLELVSEGFTVLTEKPPLQSNDDVMFMMFVRAALDLPSIDGTPIPLPVEPVTVCSLLGQEQTDSASGLLRLDERCGQRSGTKHEMTVAAALINEMDMHSPATPPCNPYKTSLKSEVIKKGKKVRGIQLESQCNFQILKLHSEAFVSGWKDPADNSVVGMSTRNGDFKTIFMDWWATSRDFEPGLTWQEFLTRMESTMLHESDKKSWEASVQEQDGWIFVSWLLACLDLPDCDKSKRILARALADYINPAVLVDLNSVYSVKWRVASGSYWTTFGNTRRHGIMVKCICDFLECHDGNYGLDNCTCVFCNICREVGASGHLEPVDLALMRRFKILGDDFLAINPLPEQFDKVLDKMCGTTTVTVVRPAFGVPSLSEPGSAEFLRRHFYLDKRSSPWNIRTFRAPGRLFAKLFHGGNRHSREKFYAATMSALVDCGYNAEVYRLLFDMLHMGPLNEESLEAELKKYAKKHPILADLVNGFIPSFYDLAADDASLIGPACQVACNRKARKYGMNTAMFNSMF